MTGFEDLSRVKPEAKGHSADFYKTADLSSDDILRYVQRGRQIRSAHLAAWGRATFETWKSLFRRPGSAQAPLGRRAPV